MIAILRYRDLGQSLFAHELADIAHDRILLERIEQSEFPVFDMTTELVDGIARRKAGEFNISLSLLDTTTSHQGLSLWDFLTKASPGALPAQQDYTFRFIMIVETGGFTFFGTFKSEDIERDLTYINGKYNANIFVRDALREMADYAETLTSEFGITNLNTFTFESYMNAHCVGGDSNFAPLMYLPSTTFGERIGDTSCVFTGSLYDIPDNYTDWRTVSRWETFKELSKGLGFDYDLELRGTLTQVYALWQTIPRELFKLRIFWREDINSETPITLTRGFTHIESVIGKTKPYLFLGYRHAIFGRLPNQSTPPAFTGIRGILYDGTDYVDSDSQDNTNPLYPHYNFFLRTTNASIADGFNPNETLLYIYGNGDEFVYNDSEINEIPLTLYSHPGFGGGFATAGSIAYARMFNCTDFNFLPIQRYVINSYKRYIVGAGLQGKIISAHLDDLDGLRLYKPIVIDSTRYEVTGITGLDIPNRQVKLGLQQSI